MQITLAIADVLIEFHSERQRWLSERMQKFIVDAGDSGGGNEVGSTDMKSASMVEIVSYSGQRRSTGKPCGKDLLLTYYHDGDDYYCEATDKHGPVIAVTYDADCKKIHAELNETAYPGTFVTLDKVFQLLPIKRLLLKNNVFMLHSSCVSVTGKRILFTGPSGIGKSTQAHLWQQYAAAEICCNDRTVLRCVNNMWGCYGYPIDGSEPVAGPMGGSPVAIVALSWGEENHVKRLAAGALPYLISQTVMDVWDEEARDKVMHLWLQLLEKIPVYLLTCRPNEGAVTCLQNKLREDGVFDA